jgi:hypothetical protein
MINNPAVWRDSLFCRSRFFFFFWFGILEVGDTGFDEDIVPGDELFDVAVLNAVLIPFGENFAEVGTELFA